jgi:hypothetical protein
VQTFLQWKNNKYFIFWLCDCSLSYKHAMRMCRVILPSVARPAVQNFSALNGIKRHDFRKSLLNISCVFWFSLQRLSVTFLILSIVESDIVMKEHLSSCRVPEILVRFQRNFDFLDRLSKSTHIKFHENPSSGSWVVPCGRGDGHDEANGRSFAIMPTCLKIS